MVHAINLDGGGSTTAIAGGAVSEYPLGRRGTSRQ
ncbi:phosphodiester glycosidase family protein [Arthrobacter sp. I3]